MDDAQTVTVTKVAVPGSAKEHWDRVFLVLLAATVLFAVMAIGISKWSPSDGQTFQLICTLTSGFSGACLGRIKPASGSAATQTTTTDQK